MSNNFSLFVPFQLPSPVRLKCERELKGHQKSRAVVACLLSTIALPVQPELLWDLVQGEQHFYECSLSLEWVLVLPLEKNETPAAFEPFSSTAADSKALLSPATEAQGHLQLLSFPSCSTTRPKTTTHCSTAEAFEPLLALPACPNCETLSWRH